MQCAELPAHTYAPAQCIPQAVCSSRQQGIQVPCGLVTRTGSKEEEAEVCINNSNVVRCQPQQPCETARHLKWATSPPTHQQRQVTEPTYAPIRHPKPYTLTIPYQALKIPQPLPLQRHRDKHHLRLVARASVQFGLGRVERVELPTGDATALTAPRLTVLRRRLRYSPRYG